MHGRVEDDIEQTEQEPAGGDFGGSQQLVKHR